MFDGYDVLYEDSEEAILLVVRESDGVPFQMYFEDGDWKIDRIVFNEDMTSFELAEPRETITLEWA